MSLADLRNTYVNDVACSSLYACLKQLFSSEKLSFDAYGSDRFNGLMLCFSGRYRKSQDTTQ